MTFLRVLGQSRMDKRLKQKQIIFSGRPCYIRNLERTTDTELSALCEFRGRAFYLREMFHDKLECDDRYAEIMREKKYVVGNP